MIIKIYKENLNLQKIRFHFYNKKRCEIKKSSLEAQLVSYELNKFQNSKGKEKVKILWRLKCVFLD